METKINSYKDLIVWQKAMDFCEEVYRVTNSFPKAEVYGLTSQIRRSSVSIPSNMAEGYRRGHKAEYVQFLRIAYGSGAELETQILIALRIGYLSKDEFTKLNSQLEEIMKMLNKLISRLGSYTLRSTPNNLTKGGEIKP